MSRKNRIDGALAKDGTWVTLKYKPVANAAIDGDWPDPNDAPTTPPPPDSQIKAFVWSGLSGEVSSQFRSRDAVANTTNVREEGVLPSEYATMFCSASVDLNPVDYVVWQSSKHRVLYSDLYEYGGEGLAQQAVLMRVSAADLLPHV